MRRLAIGLVPIYAGLLVMAQDQTTRTVTQTTTWNGTLVDAACQSGHSEHKETTVTRNPDSVTTRTETTRSDTSCPVTSTTTTYGILTRDGRFIQFDQPSNARVTRIIRENRTWNQDVASSRPMQVQVVGTPNGDVAVVETMVEPGRTVQIGEASRSTPPAAAPPAGSTRAATCTTS